MFQGEYRHSLDSKGRLILPAKIREELGDTFTITRGLDGCLYIYAPEDWKKFSEKIHGLPQSSKQSRKVQRHFIGASQNCEVDKQGRFLIPSSLRDDAHIEKDVTVLGLWDHIELWSSEVYEAYQNDDDVSIEDMAAELDF